MAIKEKTVYYCTECGNETMKWQGRCPACGQWVEVFVKMGGSPKETGRLISDETCDCGFVLQAGTCESDYQR